MNITHHDTPAAIPAQTSSQLLTATSERSVTDNRGRTLTIRKPSLLSQFKLVELLGATAENRTYLNMVLPVLYVSKIDGEALRFPASRLELEVLIQRIDEDGLEAVHLALAEQMAEEAEDKALEALKK